MFNPFSAMHAAPSLGWQPVKGLNLKSLRLFPPIRTKAFSPNSHEHVKGFLSKCIVLKVDLLQDHQIHCLQACMCALFSPEILQAGAVKGLNYIIVPCEKFGSVSLPG